MRYLLLIFAFCFIVLSGCSTQDLTEENLDAEIDSLIAQNNLGRAEVLVKNFLVKQPSSVKARSFLVTIYSEQGKYDEAIQQFEKIDSLVAPKFHVHILEAFYFTGDSEGAYLFYDDLFMQADTEAKANFVYALISARSNAGTSKLVQMLTHDEIEPELSALINGAVQIQSNSNNESFISALQTISASQSDMKSWAILQSLAANFYNNIRQYDESEEYFKQYIQNRPQHFLAYLSLAELYLVTDKLDEADTQIDFILSISPNQPIANQFKARVLLGKNDLNSAKDYLERAISYGYVSSSNYLVAGAINYELGNFEQAISQLQVGLRGSSVYSRYNRMLDYAIARTSNETSDVQAVSEETDVRRLRSLLAGFIDSANETGLQQILTAITTNTGNSPESNFDYLIMQPSLDEENVSLLVDLAKGIATESDKFSVTGEKAKVIYISSLVDKGLFNDAILTVQEWIKKDASTSIDYILLIDLYLQQKQPSKALETLANVPLELRSAAFDSREAQIYFTNGNPDKAAISIKKALMKNPYSLTFLKQFVAIELVSSVGKDEGFISSIYPHTQKLPNDAIYKSMYFAMHSNFTQAVSILDSLQVSRRDSYQYFFLLAQHYIQLDDTESAKAAIIQSLNINTSELTGAYDVISTMGSLGLVDEKQALLESLIERLPNSNKLKFELVRHLISQNKSAEAIKVLEKIDVANEEKLTLRAIAYRNTGKLAEAKKQFKAAYEIYGSEESLLLYAQHLAAIGAVDEAKNYTKKYLDKHDKSVKAIALLASYSEYSQKVSLYKRALELSPNDLLSLTNLAWALYEKENNSVEAKQYIQKAQGLAPDNQIVQNTYKTIME